MDVFFYTEIIFKFGASVKYLSVKILRGQCWQLLIDVSVDVYIQQQSCALSYNSMKSLIICLHKTLQNHPTVLIDFYDSNVSATFKFTSFVHIAKFQLVPPLFTLTYLPSVLLVHLTVYLLSIVLDTVRNQFSSGMKFHI